VVNEAGAGEGHGYFESQGTRVALLGEVIDELTDTFVSGKSKCRHFLFL